MLEVPGSERTRRSRADRKLMYWGFGALIVSILLSYGPKMILSLLAQGRSVLPPVNDPGLKWTGTDAEFFAFVVQWIVGALLWLGSLLIFLRIKSNENQKASRIGLFLALAVLVYGLLTVGNQATRIDPQW